MIMVLPRHPLRYEYPAATSYTKNFYMDDQQYLLLRGL
jgi:hypothetical protein